MKYTGRLLASAGVGLLALGVGGGIAVGDEGAASAGEFRVEQIEPSAAAGALAPPDDSVCYGFFEGDVKHGESCFEWSGDDQWVRDTRSNNKQFRVHVFTEYGKDRYCADDTAGWTECKYDHREGECVAFHGYYPPHSAGDSFPSTRWISISTGGACSPD